MKEKDVKEMKNAVKKTSKSKVYEALLFDDGSVFISNDIKEYEYQSMEEAKKDFLIF